MEVYMCCGYVPSGCGCCEGDSYINPIVANTEQEALGLALEAHPDTRAENWAVKKVDRTVFGIFDIEDMLY